LELRGTRVPLLVVRPDSTEHVGPALRRRASSFPPRGVRVPRWGGAASSSIAGRIAEAGRNWRIPQADRPRVAFGIALAEDMQEITKR